MPQDTGTQRARALDPVEEKKLLRRRMRSLRANLPPDAARIRSLRAQERLAVTTYWKNARAVALYAANRDELSTEALLEQAWTSGRAVYLPRVRHGEPGLMEFVLCRDPAELAPAAFGLREPMPGLPGFGAEEAGKKFKPDMLVVPGLAFDGTGMRLGFGGGYYDRFLNLLTACPCVGLCFEFQLVEELPAEAWDRPVHFICTEEYFREVRPCQA